MFDSCMRASVVVPLLSRSFVTDPGAEALIVQAVHKHMGLLPVLLDKSVDELLWSNADSAAWRKHSGVTKPSYLCSVLSRANRIPRNHEFPDDWKLNMTRLEQAALLPLYSHCCHKRARAPIRGRQWS